MSQVPKTRISVTVDSELLQEVDRLASNRSKAIEEALRLWRRQQIEKQLQQFYQNRSQSDIEFEQEWVEETQDQAIAAWDKFVWDIPDEQ